MAAAAEALRHRLPPQVILLRGLILACFRWDFVECGFDGGVLGILAVVDWLLLGCSRRACRLGICSGCLVSVS
jgi:hypothetical protein